MTAPGWSCRCGGGRTTVISDATLAAEHQCSFWDSLPAAAG
jgi:hypothetical protein